MIAQKVKDVVKLIDYTADLRLPVRKGVFLRTDFLVGGATFTNDLFNDLENLKVRLQVFSLQEQGPLASIAMDRA